MSLLPNEGLSLPGNQGGEQFSNHDGIDIGLLPLRPLIPTLPVGESEI
jgi:hypothetical protein